MCSSDLFRPELLHKFNPSHADNTFASPRTWEFLSKIIIDKQQFTRTDHAVLVGTVGEGPATEFRAFCDVYKDLPTIDDMLENPTLVNIPKEPGHQYAMTTLISHHSNDDTIEALMIVTKKLPIEFQVVVLKDIYSLAPELKKNPIIQDWVSSNADKLFG